MVRLPISRWGALLGVPVHHDGSVQCALELLARHDVTFAELQRAVASLAASQLHTSQTEAEQTSAATLREECIRIAPLMGQRVETQCKYEPMVRRHQADIDALRKREALDIPADIDYCAIPQLSAEEREKLARARPATLAAAGRVAGVTPAGMVVLMHHVLKRIESRQAE